LSGCERGFVRIASLVTGLERKGEFSFAIGISWGIFPLPKERDENRQIEKRKALGPCAS
jgi:hypothetical protein